MTANPTVQPTRTSGADEPVDRPLRYRGRRLDGPVREFHAAVDGLQADTIPYTYYAKVMAGHDRAAAER